MSKDKQEFTESARNAVEEVFAKMGEYEVAMHEVPAEQKSKFEQLMAELRTKKADLKKRYDALEHSTEEKWGETKIAFSESLKSFKDGFSKLASIFK